MLCYLFNIYDFFYITEYNNMYLNCLRDTISLTEQLMEKVKKKRYRILNGQKSKMDNLEKLVTQGTQDEEKH